MGLRGMDLAVYSEKILQPGEHHPKSFVPFVPEENGLPTSASRLGNKKLPFIIFVAKVAFRRRELVVGEKSLEKKLIEALKAHKHSVTSQRILIFRALARRRDHPTAEKLHEQLAKEVPDLSLATVYKNLHLFEKIGLARAVASPDGRARFDVPMIPHHHLFCTRCGSIVDIEDGVRIELAPFLEQETGFRITGAELILEGVCGKCQRVHPEKRGFRQSRRERQSWQHDRPDSRGHSF